MKRNKKGNVISLLLVLLIIGIIVVLISIFTRNPDKTPDLVITLLGGAVAGLIGFFAAKQAYKEQRRYEEEKQKRDMIIELQNEVMQNKIQAKNPIPIRGTPSNPEASIYTPLKTLAWNNFKRINYGDEISKEMQAELFILYIMIENYNIYCRDFTTAKNNCITNPGNATLKGVLQKHRKFLDIFYNDPLKGQLETCFKLLVEKIQSNIDK